MTSDSPRFVLLTVLSAASLGLFCGRCTIAQKTAQTPWVLVGREPKPEEATRAILDAFDKYEVVGMPAAHGAKDVDDLILRLIRDPAFAALNRNL